MILQKITKKVSYMLATLVLMTAQMTPFFAFAPKASATVVSEGKIEICHRTNSATNPYVLIEVDANAVDGESGNSGNEADHYGEHKGPIADSVATAKTLKDAKTEWGDIIPPVSPYHTGLNYTETGAQILRNRCDLREPTSVIVKKNLIPSSDTGKFDLYVNDTKKVEDGGDEATSSKVLIDDKENLNVKEKAGVNEDGLLGYTTTIECTNLDDEVIASGTGTGELSRSLTVNKNVIEQGDQIICVFTNTAIPKTGTVKVVKEVVNDNGGKKTSLDFTFTNNQGDALTFETTTSPDGERLLTLPLGSTFLIKEVQEDSYGYKTTYSGTCTGTVTSTEQVCTIKNDDKQAYIIVDKTVVGGTAQPNDFKLRVGNDSVLDGIAYPVDPGTYTVSETNISTYSPGVWGTDCEENGTVKVALGETKTCTITNTAKPVTVVATKIVCDNEALLPNYGTGGPNITAMSAIDWVSKNSGCKLAEGWNFEYAFNNASNPGDNKEVGGSGWTVFGQTGTNGQAKAEINDISGINRIWVREQLKDGYLGFSYNIAGNNNDALSAEIYCNEDVLNYDNFDFIDRPTIGNSYYCVAWNVAEKGRVEVTKFNDKNNNGRWDDEEETLSDWEMELTPIYECDQEESESDCEDPETITQLTNADGVAIFSNVKSGWYTVGEDDKAGWDQTVIYCDDEYQDSVLSRTSDEEETKDIYVGAGQTVRCYIGNYDTPGGGGSNPKTGNIVVTKFNDTNKNGKRDEGEPTLPGWEINVEGVGSVYTGLDGTATFSNLKPGDYIVTETMQSGWVQTVNECANNESDECEVGEGKTVYCLIGNYKTPDSPPPAVLGVTTTTPPAVLAVTGDSQSSYALVVGFTLIAATMLTVLNRKKESVSTK